MRFTKLIIALALPSLSDLAQARIELPRFNTKQSLENIRFITEDGRYTYSQKRSGALAMSSSFKSTDVIESPPGTNYYVVSSQMRKRMLVEVEKDWHRNLDLNKNHDIMAGSFPAVKFSKIGEGRSARLHLDDQWASWYDPQKKIIHLVFLNDPGRHHQIKLGIKHNPFFIPDVVMLNPETLLYTDVNEKGFSALLSWNLLEKRMTVLRKAESHGTRMELCRRNNYIALGEFPHEGTVKGSRIMTMSWQESPVLTGWRTLYHVSDNDLGQIICDERHIWFVKTMSEDKRLNSRRTEAATLSLSDGQVSIKSELEYVTQITEMDGRIFLPFREDIFVLSGNSQGNIDTLRTPPNQKEAP